MRDLVTLTSYDPALPGTRKFYLASSTAFEQLARLAEERLQPQSFERQTAAERIRRIEVAVTYAPVVLGTGRSLVDVQREELKQERTKRSWWRSLLRGVCVAGPKVGGAAAVTLAAGPEGAAVGATVGLAVGALACRSRAAPLR